MLYTAISWNFGSLHWMWFPPQLREARDYVHNYINHYFRRVLRSGEKPLEKTASGSENTNPSTSETVTEAPKKQRYVFLEAVAAVVRCH